ncbi:hypothetical protein D9M71_703150 [compost metagenome]
MAHAVHLLGEGFLAQQGAVALHQDQARFHGVEVHLHPAFGLGANPAVGHHQGFAIGHPRHLMRTEAVGGNLTTVHQPFAFELIHAEQAAARIGGVVFGGVQPVAAVVNDRVTVEVPVRL